MTDRPDYFVKRCPKCGRKNRFPATASRKLKCGRCKAPLDGGGKSGARLLAACAVLLVLTPLILLWVMSDGSATRDYPAPAAAPERPGPGPESDADARVTVLARRFAEHLERREPVAATVESLSDLVSQVPASFRGEGMFDAIASEHGIDLYRSLTISAEPEIILASAPYLGPYQRRLFQNHYTVLLRQAVRIADYEQAYRFGAVLAELTDGDTPPVADLEFMIACFALWSGEQSAAFGSPAEWLDRYIGNDVQYVRSFLSEAEALREQLPPA